MEQGTHKPLDVGSNPTLATVYLNNLIGGLKENPEPLIRLRGGEEFGGKSSLKNILANPKFVFNIKFVRIKFLIPSTGLLAPKKIK